MPPVEPAEAAPAPSHAPSFTPEPERIERRLGVTPPGEPLPLRAALLARTRLGPVALPGWALGLSAVLAVAGVSVWLAPAGTRADEPLSRTDASAPLVPVPSAIGPALDSPRAPHSKRAPSTLLERATAGDREALDDIARRPLDKRTAAEVLAHALGRDALRHAQVRALGKRLQKSAETGIEPKDFRELFDLINDRHTSVSALAEVAKIEHSIGPDLLFHVWTATRQRTDTTRLAEELLFSRDVRGRASPALAVVLNLRDTKDCGKVRDILASALKHADRRSLVGLGRLKRRTGCGAGERGDCYACLRDSQEIEEAIKAAAAREPPTFP